LKGKRIVITGGPGTGKTAVIDALATQGHYCFQEIIRSMTLEAKKQGGVNQLDTNPLAFVQDSKAFNTELLQGRLQQFKKATELVKELFFYDRGLPDVLAYMDYFKQPYGADFTKTCEANLYDQVFILPPWKAIYVQDSERLESYEQATEIHHCLVKTYTSLGYEMIEVPFANVTERVQFMCANIQK